jgi:hypothetical protein
VSGPARRPPGRAVSPSREGQARAVVQAVAAHGLPGAPPIPSVDPAAETWHRIIRLAEQQRVLGLLVAAVEAGAVPDELGEEVRDELARTHEAWCAHDLRLERALGQAGDALDEAAIAYLVTKGPALAHGAYLDPGQRLFADLDLIVPGDHLRRATTVLGAALDAQAVVGELRPGFDERFGKETLLRTPARAGTPAGLEIDLHRTPVAGALGLAIELDDLFDGPGELVLGARHHPIPDAAASVVLAAYQASVADIPPRLGARRDLVQLCLVQSPAESATIAAIDAEAVISLARRWRAGAMLAAAVTEAWTELDLPPPGPDQTLAGGLVTWARSYRPPLGERTVLDAHRRPGYVYWRQLVGVSMVSGTSDRLRYLRALLWPQRDYLADRSWSMGRHLRRAVRTLDAPIRHRLVELGRRVGRRSGLRG